MAREEPQGTTDETLRRILERLEALEVSRSEPTDVSSVGAPSVPVVTSRVGKPEAFDGFGDIETWLFTLRLYFTAINLPEADKIVHTGVLLRKEAAEWYRMHTERLESLGGSIPDFESLAGSLKQQFTVGNKQKLARERLYGLRQGHKTVREYVKAFRASSVSLAGAQEGELISFFMRGLSDAVEVQVESLQLKQLSEVVEAALRIGGVLDGKKKTVHLVEDEENVVWPVQGVTRRGEMSFPISITGRGSLLNTFERALKEPWIRSKVIGHLLSNYPDVVRGFNTPQGTSKRADIVETEGTEEILMGSYDEVQMLNTPLGPNSNKSQMHVHSLVGGKPVVCFLDSGATVNIMHEHTRQRLGYKANPGGVTLLAFGENKVQSVGVASLQVKIGPAVAQLEFQLVPGKGKCILGKPGLGELSLALHPRKDQLVHDPSGEVVQCFALQELKGTPTKKVVYAVAGSPQEAAVEARTTQTYSLEPGQEELLDVGLSIDVPYGRCVCVQPLPGLSFQVSPNVYLGKCRDQSVQLVARNPTESRIQVEEGLAVATLQSMDVNRAKAGKGEEQELKNGKGPVRGGQKTGPTKEEGKEVRNFS